MVRRAHQGDIIVGLDVGTTKICAVVGEVVDGELEMRGVSTSASTGLRKGVVVNIESTVESIKNALKTAGSFTGVEINAVYVGISGGHIKGFNSYGAVTSVQNLLKCCEKIGIEVIDIVFEPLASAGATLTDDEKELGVAIVDIGGGTTDIILYKNGWLRHTSVLGIGGNHFTNDIAVGLRISVSEAERVKKSLGTATINMVNDSEEIDIIQAGQGRKILRRCLSEIIQPRTEELLDLI